MIAAITAFRVLANSVAAACRADARACGKDRVARADALRTSADRLDAVDWTADDGPVPPTGSVPALRHLPAALALAREARDRAAADALPSSIGHAPWSTFYADDDWACPFLHEVACAALVGPTGIVHSDRVALGLFLLGPNTTYREHAHALHEVYYVLGGRAEWGLDRENNRHAFGPGALVHTGPDQRHDIRTADEPIICAYVWTNDPAAPTYRRSEGPWGGGEAIEPPLVDAS